MGFNRPTLSEIQQRGYADFRSELPGDEPTLPASTEYALVAANSGMSHLKHGRIDFAMRQQFPDTADGEGLDHHLSWWGLSRQQPTFASGNVRATGTPLTLIPAGQQVISPQDSLTYTSQSAVTTDSFGQAIVPVLADAVGSAYNKQPKTILQFSTPPAGIDSQCLVDGVAVGITFGTDLESDESALERLLARIQRGPVVGRPGDWARLAREVSGVTRAWEVAGFAGPGSVGVFFTVDNDPISAVPNPAQVAQVQAYIDAEAPIAYTSVVLAPTDDPIVIAVTIDPDTADIRNAIDSEISDLLLRTATPEGFLLTTVELEQAISRGVGTGAFTMTSPGASVAYSLGFMPVTFTVNYF